jgi:hypothetical protein
VLAFKPLKCPQCNECIHRLQLMKGECPFCHTDIGAARSYQRCIGLLTLVTIALLAVATHESTSGGAWLLGIFLSAIPCWIMFLNVVPPWLKRGHAQPRITLVSSWLGVALTVFLVEFMGFGALYVFFGSSRRELLEHLATVNAVSLDHAFQDLFRLVRDYPGKQRVLWAADVRLLSNRPLGFPPKSADPTVALE